MSEGGNTTSGRDSRGKFKPGVSGNPNGRRAGTPDRRSKLRRLLDEHGEELVLKALELAKGGDREALQFCLSRLIPVARETEETANLAIPHGASLAERVRLLSEAAMSGEIAPSVAQTLARVIEVEARVAEFGELQDRIAALERAKAGT